MAAATGFSFGTAAAATTTAATGFSFGSTAAAKPAAATGFSFGGAAAAATTTAAATGFSFGATTSTAATTTASAFGTLGAAAATTSASGGLFGGLFGKSTAASTGGLFGSSTTTTASTGLFGATSTAAAASAAAPSKPLENPKEANLPNELTTLVTDIETYVTGQKDAKEEVSKISSEGITTVREEIAVLKQSIALIANSLQRDTVAAENLKIEVGHELKNAEIAQRIKDPYVGLHHDVGAPMEYFQRLVYSFETRINIYRREIEELETFISSSISPHQFTPQDLSNVLKRLNDSFIGLASELQQVHEAIKMIKEKYLHFRRVIYNDSYDPFVARKKLTDVKGKANLTGPSPFPVIQGASLMASAFKADVAKPSAVTFNTPGLASTFAKPAGTGLTRSLSFGGSANKSTGFGGSSLFGKTATSTATGFGAIGFGATPASTTSTPFQLQKPPSGKRGKIF